MKTISLSELTAFVRRVFALNLPEAVWVSAEIAEANKSRGHYWLRLVEKEEGGDLIAAQLDAVLWKFTHKKLAGVYGLPVIRNVLQKGMSVRLRVTTSFHPRYGLKLVVEDLDPSHTLGVLETRRQATLETLEREGVLDRNAGRPFPTLPLRLAVISSHTAAGLQDFEEQLARNPYGYVFRSDVFPAAMQGEQTRTEIAAQLRKIERRRADYDCIVIVRGGGGKLDLAVFDDEELARTVARAPLPVLTGIGHEQDRAVVDRVVHRACKTPTAAAVYLIERLVQQESHTLRVGRMIGQLGNRSVSAATTRLGGFRQGLRYTAQSALQSQHLRTAARTEKLEQLTQRNLLTACNKLEHYEQLLTALRPKTTLARGYALVSQAGRLVTDARQVSPELPLDIKLQKGRLRRD